MSTRGHRVWVTSLFLADEKVGRRQRLVEALGRTEAECVDELARMLGEFMARRLA